MKTHLGILASVLALAAPLGVAHADGPADASHKTALAGIPVLPKGSFSLPKTSIGTPKNVGANEKVEGFFVEVPDHLAQMREAPRYVMVWASKEQRDARNQGTFLSGAPVCFMNAYPSGSAEVNWSGSLNTSTTVQNYARAGVYGSPGYGSVQMVRSERIISETATKLTYEVKVAYVDSETQGVRLISTQKFDMALVQELPGQVRVWGMQSDDEMTFLVRRTQHEKERFSFGSLMVMVNGQQQMSSSEACPVVFNLKAQKGMAASAIVHVETVLDVQDVNQDEKSTFPLPQMVNPQAQGPREARIRPLRIGLSSTWMSKDAAAVLSVSSGWAGKERTQPI